MIRNYLKVAVRSLLKQKIYTFINVTGLSVGIASCILIGMFITYEFSYDKFNVNADDTYKVVLERKYPNHSTLYQIIPHSYCDVIMSDFPEVERLTRMSGPFNNQVISYKKSENDIVQFEESNFMLGDSAFFDIFSIKLLKGDSESALSGPNNIVVTEETAERYFGDDEPLGKTLNAGFAEFKVAGVCENIPSNSHLKFDFLASIATFPFQQQINYISFSSHVYIQLREGANPASVEEKFPKMVDTYAAAQIERDLQKSWEDYKKEGNGYRYFLQPLKSIHLDPANFEAKITPGGNITYIYILISVAGLILIIACINFMNLATSRSTERAREVGVRKTMGSQKSQLVFQFLTESIIVTVTSMIIALVIVQLATPFFNSIGNTSINFNLSAEIIAGLIFFALFVGLGAGIYPAFVLSSFNPAIVIKGNFSSSSKGLWMRNGLVIFQFWISIILIVSTLVVARQMEYMQNKALGFDKEHLMVVERAFALNDKNQTFLDQLEKLPGVKSVAGSSAMIGRQTDFFGSQFQPKGSSEILTTKSMALNDEFVETIGLTLIEGRSFSEETNDSLNIMLNQSALKTLGISDPIGQQITMIQRNANGNIYVPYTIIGVIEDFHFQSLRDEITPLTIVSTETFGGGFGYIYVRIDGSQTMSTVKNVESAWKELVPQAPFKFTFLDDNLNAQYQSERRAGEIFATFSGLAILIACVGLFGLAAYTSGLRTKEIGIRKVMGASVGSVILLLSKDFTKLILIAFVLAVPAGWYLMNMWLENFAYRIEIGIGTFLLSGLLSLAIAWITVSYQSIKAAIVDPVKSLRSE